jgi:hypothetical protein
LWASISPPGADIDNAGDLDTIGGLRPTIELLSHASGRVQQAALWVVGSAVQSNPKVQEQVLNYGALPTILEPIRAASFPPDGAASAAAGTDPRVLAKGLYALSALLRGCGRCLEDFAARGGAAVLALLLSQLPPGPDWLPARRKAAALAGDLARGEASPAAAAALAAQLALGGEGGGEHPPALLGLLPQLRSRDRELQEKALEAMAALLHAHPPAAGIQPPSPDPAPRSVRLSNRDLPESPFPVPVGRALFERLRTEGVVGMREAGRAGRAAWATWATVTGDWGSIAQGGDWV